MNYKQLFFMLIAVFMLAASCKEKKEKVIYYNAFSHNDYTRSRPLLDALNHGFNCVEVDIHLINGKLIVSHDHPEDLSKTKTLEELYLQPISEEVKRNRGLVYPHTEQPFLLMIDFKTQGDSCYSTLKPLLEQYKRLFCSIENGRYQQGPIMIFFSGNRPLATLPQENTRMAFLDGKLDDLNKNIPATLMPVVSDEFSKHFNWDGKDKMPEKELTKLREILSQTRIEGKKLRFWGGPTTKEYLQMQIEEGVDIIGTDDLMGLRELLSKWHTEAKQ